MNDSGKLLIRPARSDEAQDVLELKRLSFADTTLPFTIYRAPTSVRYIENMIRAASDSGTDYISVAVAEDKMVGYYLASQYDETRFLNYIAVASDFHGRGIGFALLADFEARGFRNGCSQYMLDAVQKNSKVLEWYSKHGYSPVGTYNHARLRMGTPDGATQKLRWDEAAWMAATAQEVKWGFAKCKASMDGGQLEIGLIDGTVCKLLSWNGVTLETAISAVMAALANARTELIISNLSTVPADWPCLQRLEVVRLLKASK